MREFTSSQNLKVSSFRCGVLPAVPPCVSVTRKVIPAGKLAVRTQQCGEQFEPIFLPHGQVESKNLLLFGYKISMSVCVHVLGIVLSLHTPTIDLWS